MSAIPGTGSGRWKGSVHSRVRILDLALLLALAACGSGVSPATPTAPTASTAAPPTPQTLTVVNGLNHSVTVPALEVAVDSQRYVTDGGGTLTASVGSGSTIATSGGAGFVERETTYGGESELALWPLEGSWDAAYYRAIVYDRPWSSGLAPLVRPEPGVFSVSVSAAIASDPAALGMVKAALSEVARVTRDAIQFVWVEAAGDITYEISETDPLIGKNWGVSALRLSGNCVTGCRIIIRRLDVARLNVAIHETGHFLGLCHSPDPSDIMCVAEGRSYVSTRLGRGEESAWLMMAQRKPGNRYPDKDPTIARAAALSGTLVVRCGG